MALFFQFTSRISISRTPCDSNDKSILIQVITRRHYTSNVVPIQLGFMSPQSVTRVYFDHVYFSNKHLHVMFSYKNACYFCYRCIVWLAYFYYKISLITYWSLLHMCIVYLSLMKHMYVTNPTFYSTADIVSGTYPMPSRPSVRLSVNLFFKSNRLPQFSSDLCDVWRECAQQYCLKSCGNRILIFCFWVLMDH